MHLGYGVRPDAGQDPQKPAPGVVQQPSRDHRQRHFRGDVSSETGPAVVHRALALALDREAYVDILMEGEGKLSGAMLPPPEGVWGGPPEILKTFLGYDPDLAARREEARGIMRKLGYGPDNRLVTKIFTR